MQRIVMLSTLLVGALLLLPLYGQNCGSSFVMPATYFNPQSATYTPDGNYLAVGVTSGGLSGPAIFSISNGAVGSSIFYSQPNTYIGSFAQIVFSPDGKLLVNPGDTTAMPATIAAYDVNNGVLSNPAVYTTPRGPHAARFTPDGLYVAFAMYTLNQIIVFANNNNVLVQDAIYDLPYGVTAPFDLAFSPDGQYLVVANSGASDMTIFTVVNGQLINPTSYLGASGVAYFKFSPDGQHLAAITGSQVTVFGFNNGVIGKLNSYNLVPSTAYATPLSIDYSPNGQMLAISGSGSRHTISVYPVFGDTLGSAVVYDVPGISNSVARFSPDGNYLATTFISQQNYILLIPVSCFDISSTGSASRSSTSLLGSLYALVKGDL